MKKCYNIHGFSGYEFMDKNNNSCSIQESSADTPSIWLGLNEIKPQLFLPDIDITQKGWIDYPIPDCVRIFGRMELTQENVKELLPDLEYFAEHGVLPKHKED